MRALRSSPRLARLLPLTALAALGPGCTDGAAPHPAGTGRFAGDVYLGAPAAPVGTGTRRPLASGAHTIFVNFDGATLQANYDDAAHDASSIVAANPGHSVAWPAMAGSDIDPSGKHSRAQAIADIMARVRFFYQDFDVDVVSTRPSSGNYVMAMVGGSPGTVGQPCGSNGCVLGLAPLDCQRQGPYGVQVGSIWYNAQDDVEVVFAFTATYPQFGGTYTDNVGIAAATIAQETAHSYGLGHSTNANDVMYPEANGSTTGFLAGGYADSNNCAGGAGTQDSHALLIKILGAATSAPDTTPPTVSITSPAQGATVGASFTASATASDDVAVGHVHLDVTDPSNHTIASQDFTAPPYTIAVTATTDGIYSVGATAFDAVGNKASAIVSFTVQTGGMMTKGGFGASCGGGGDCQSGSCLGGRCTESCGSCPSGYTCNAQHLCAPGSSSGGKDGGASGGEVGASCSGDRDCQSGLCATQSGMSFCTASCDPKKSGSCPSDLVCASQGSAGSYCAFPSGGGGGGGCSAGGGDGSTAGTIAFTLSLLALAAMRRRASSATGRARA